MLLGAVVMLATVATVITVVGAGASNWATNSPPSFAVHSPAAARVTASAVFADLQLPSGVLPLSHLDEAELANLGYYAITQSGVVDKVGLWQVTMGIDQTASFIEHHVPRWLIGSPPSIDVIPNGNGLVNGTINYSSTSPTLLENAPRPFAQVTYNLSMSPSTSHTTSLLVGVQVYWTPLRPAAEEVPPDARVLKVSKVGSHAGSNVPLSSGASVSTTTQSVIRNFAKVLAGLPVQFPLTRGCSAPPITPSAVIYRYVLSFGSSAIAKPSVVVDLGACGYVAVAVNGKAMPPLLDVAHSGGLVVSEYLNRAIEQLFSPGVPLTFYG